jgi:glycosyltransferase involved in cell wall biosynthesis
VGEENGILVTPGDVAEIKEAIRTLKNSKSLREKMGGANRRKIEEHYSWRHIAERFLDVYESGL